MARCPNCMESLHRGADGDYPPKCPKCGVRFKSKTKRPAAATVPHTPPTVDERVVRSFSSRRHETPPPGDPFSVSHPVESVDDAVETPIPENPFVAPAPLADADPFAVEPGRNPFAPPPTVTSAPAEAAAVLNPFGASEVAAPVVRTPRTGLIKGIVAGVLILAVGGVGVWVGQDLLKGPPPKERPGFVNPGRNYVFYALPSPWKPDEGRAVRAGYELVLHRADLGGWVTLTTEVVKDEPLDLKEVAEQVGSRWKDRVPDFTPAETLGRIRLAGLDAVSVDGEGTLDGKPVRGRTVVLVAGGVKYLMGFEAPVDEWDKLERDFALARDSLELTGGTAAPATTLGATDVLAFESKKFPYRLSTPPGWREVPDLLTDSRFDDLKLQDKARLGEVVVQPRETKDLPGMRVRYVETQQRRYESKVREVESAIEKLTIRGRPAMRTLLIVQNAGGDFMLYATFVQDGGYVYQIQCRAPVEKRDAYEPLFEKITSSFETFERPPAPPEQEPPAPEKTEPKEPVKDPVKSADKKPDAEATKAPPVKTEPNKKEMKADPKAADAEKKPAEATPTKSPDAGKKPEPTKKKKSLDDLD
jgi:hypothetical protein